MSAAHSIDDVSRMVAARIAEQEAESAPVQEEARQAHILFSTAPESSTALRYRAAPEPLPWVFEGFGILGTAGIISAAGGTGKTWLELILSAMLRTGVPFLGDDLRPLRKGRVVIVFPEDPEQVKHHRVHALCDALGAQIGESHLLEGLFTPELYGEDMSLVTKGPKGFETTEAFDALVDYVTRCGDVVMVVLDPLNLLHGIDLETDPAAAQYFASRMAFLARETNAFVLVAHHSTKGEIDPDKFKIETALSANTIRGSGAILAGFRSALTLATLPERYAKSRLGLPEKPAPGEYIAARVSKNNYGPIGKPFFLRKDMETGMLHPVRPATRKVESIEKTRVLDRFVPLIVKEVEDQEAQGKQLTKATFAAIYSKTWKSAGDETASKSTLAAAIDRALMDKYLAEEPGHNARGRATAFLTLKGALPLPADPSLNAPGSWLWGIESGEDAKC